MNYTALEKVICDTIKEEQIKLGYQKETIRLYYPMSSLTHILEEEELDETAMEKALAEFTDQVKDRLGKLQISHSESRYCILIPPEGTEYVHEHIKDNPFLIALIELVRSHHCSLEELLTLFQSYSKQVTCEESKSDEFDYVIYFDDGKQDDYRYCFKFDLGHTVYHRFSKKDFEQLELGTESEGETVEEEPVDENKEQLYQRLLTLKGAMKCMTTCDEKSAMYKKLIKQFDSLAGYKTAGECAEECRLLLKQTKKDIKKKAYKAALRKKNEARTPEDYKIAAEGFRKLSGYKDSDDLAAECDILYKRTEKKLIIRRLLNFGLTVLGIAVIIVLGVVYLNSVL